MSWNSIETAPSDVRLLVACATSSGRLISLIAVHCSKHTQEAGDEFIDSEWCDYDEASDTYYCPVGWYEQIQNWDELSACHITDMTPVLWANLPELPEFVQ